jgi:hypothetical protein
MSECKYDVSAYANEWMNQITENLNEIGPIQCESVKVEDLSEILGHPVREIFGNALELYIEPENLTAELCEKTFILALKIAHQNYKKVLNKCIEKTQDSQEEVRFLLIKKILGQIMSNVFRATLKKDQTKQPLTEAYFLAEEQFASMYEKKDSFETLMKDFVYQIHKAFVAVFEQKEPSRGFHFPKLVYANVVRYYDKHFMGAEINQDKLCAFMCFIKQLSNFYPRLNRVYEMYVILSDCEKTFVQEFEVDTDDYQPFTPGIIRYALEESLLGASLFRVIVEYLKYNDLYQSTADFVNFANMLLVMGHPFAHLGTVLTMIKDNFDFYKCYLDINERFDMYYDCGNDILLVFFESLRGLPQTPSDIEISECLAETLNELCKDININKNMKPSKKSAFIYVAENNAFEGIVTFKVVGNSLNFFVKRD